MRLTSPLKAAVFRAAYRLGYTIKRNDAPPDPHYLECDPSHGPIIKRVKPFTLTTAERIGAIVDAVHHIARAGIPGCIVECGVWRGGSVMASALALMETGDIRDIYLFDTFAGMTRPTEADIDYRGASAETQYLASAADDHVDWCYASLTDVRRNLLSTGYPENRLHFVEGDVMITLPCSEVGQIAILRLDTDWYESTFHELTHLYPKLVAGGILIIDDYGHWQGCKKAVDEYFGRRRPFLSALDSTGRLAVKPKE